MKTKFVVEPVGMKMRYYDDLGDICHDFSREELEDAHFDVISRSWTVLLSKLTENQEKAQKYDAIRGLLG